MSLPPTIAVYQDAGIERVSLSGDWGAAEGELVEKIAAKLEKGIQSAHVEMDLAEISHLDTLGAWIINRLVHRLEARQVRITFHGVSEAHQILLKETIYRVFDDGRRPNGGLVFGILADTGESVVSALHDIWNGIAFLGQVIASIGRVIRHPERFRLTTLVAQIEHVSLRGVPIIMLISFLVGAIVAQQGIFQLSRFGASAFAVDLIGILVLRELGVLLTSIMVAGRSGSAYTAEIGSMNMREEIDALRVMGLDPIEVLVVPRILALIIGLPLLTFIANISALFGGGVVSWLYGGVGPDIYIDRLSEAVKVNTVMVGLIKAPFMALVIGLISCVEGLAVKGSAESLGRRVTESVVKSIFMVIVVDGLFAMFFAAIKY
jgi:phospholipid/cholesterol/gamma-HCH transport system permease protein